MEQHRIERLKDDDLRDLRRGALSGVLLAAYRVGRLRRLCLKLAHGLEGGPFFSASLREMLLRYHGVYVGAYSYGDCLYPGVFPRGVVVGRYVSIASGVRVLLRNHPMDRLSTHPFFFNSALGMVERDSMTFGTLEIGHDAWIGDRAIITPRCRRIGIGAVVGAGAVVTRDVPDFAIVAGNPAKLIRMRFNDNTCDAVLRSKWWQKPLEQVREYMPEMGRSLPADPCEHPLLRPSQSEATVGQ